MQNFGVDGSPVRKKHRPRELLPVRRKKIEDQRSQSFPKHHLASSNLSPVTENEIYTASYWAIILIKGIE